MRSCMQPVFRSIASQKCCVAAQQHIARELETLRQLATPKPALPAPRRAKWWMPCDAKAGGEADARPLGPCRLTFGHGFGIMSGEETPMPDLDELTNTNDVAAVIRRVLTEDQIEVLFDEEGK